MEPCPDFETQYSQVLEAVRRGNADAVYHLLASRPALAQPQAAWADAPLQLALEKARWATPGEPKERALACVDHLLEAGAPLDKGGRHTSAALPYLVQHGCVGLLQHLHEKGHLTRSSGLHNALFEACNPGSWRTSSDYPLYEVIEVLVKAGALGEEHFHEQGIIDYLLTSARNSYGTRVPSTTDEGLLLLYQHQAEPSPALTHLVQAFRAGLPNTFDYLWGELQADVKLTAFPMRSQEEATRWEQWVSQAQAKQLHSATSSAPAQRKHRF